MNLLKDHIFESKEKFTQKVTVLEQEICFLGAVHHSEAPISPTSVMISRFFSTQYVINGRGLLEMSSKEGMIQESSRFEYGYLLFTTGAKYKLLDDFVPQVRCLSTLISN